MIRLHAAFEQFMLDALVGCINNRPSDLYRVTGARFPAHLRAEVCEFLVTGSRYFDVRNRDHLLEVLKGFLPPQNYLVQVVGKPAYKPGLERLWALRNFAAHRSKRAKRRALIAVSAKKMASAGAWLSKRSRLDDLEDCLRQLATDIHAAAPY
ncbi:MAG: hypothetical protein L3K16_06240 [Thermoplasmata archaeon]|nr:hypothetical protein [Thermoplasmata archaeon]